MKKFVEAELVEMKISDTQSGGTKQTKVDASYFANKEDGSLQFIQEFFPAYGSAAVEING